MNIFKKKPKITEGIDLDNWNIEYLKKLNKINTKEARKNGNDYWCWDEDVLRNKILQYMHKNCRENYDHIMAYDLGILLKFTNDETRKLVIDFINGIYHYDYHYPNERYNIFDTMRCGSDSYPETLFHSYWESVGINRDLVSVYISHRRNRIFRNAKVDENNNIIRDFYTKEESDRYFGTVRIPDQTPEEQEEFHKQMAEHVKLKGSS
jgi:hypothetical protein